MHSRSQAQAHRGPRYALAAAALLCLSFLVIPERASPAHTELVRHDWSRSALGGWKHWWGAARVVDGGLVLASRAPRRAAETYSSLVTTRHYWRDFAVAMNVRPIRRLRLGTSPNTWETGWVFFRFRDLHNYYYFILKPNGWELGKKHGSDRQIFLATGSRPRLAIGSRARVRIAARGARITVRVNGSRILSFVDRRPLRRGGAIGLYEEDARVRFGDVTIVSGH
jgi:hypothetical protein